ncbi:MAG: hypothetical protein WCC87_19280 [Candidatus Korobacteraceae bacterium]
MTIQIELSPEMMERLAAEAEAQGIALEEYAERLLRTAIATHAEPDGQLSVAELHAMLDGIAEGSEKLPKMPTAAFTRESFYEDRL